MRNVLIVFFIIALIFLIMITPFKTRFMGHLNMIELKCFYSLKVWFVKILSGMIISENGKIEMKNEETFLTGSYNEDFVKQLTKGILKEIDVKKVELFFIGGFKENSFSSAIMCGSVLSVIESLYGYLSLKFDNVKMYKDVKPTFDEDNLELTMDIVVSVSLFTLLKVLLTTTKKLTKLKEINNER